jgi:hypothetical protein
MNENLLCVLVLPAPVPELAAFFMMIIIREIDRY